jgi:hypothetical protein
MSQRTILILEDYDDRIRGFRRAVASLDREVGVRQWRDAPTMIAECAACLARACLISLDHDLAAVPGEADPGTGLEVAEFLSLHPPACPVILHTSNFDGRLAMQNRLRAAGWTVATVLPREVGWIQTSWLPAARRLAGV